MLLRDDLPVSQVGYESGFVNHSHFSEAFAGRFGLAPRDYRTGIGGRERLSA